MRATFHLWCAVTECVCVCVSDVRACAWEKDSISQDIYDLAHMKIVNLLGISKNIIFARESFYCPSVHVSSKILTPHFQ